MAKNSYTPWTAGAAGTLAAGVIVAGPLMFGGTEPWGATMLQLAAAVVGVLWLVGGAADLSAFLLWLPFVGVAAVQLAPWPDAILGALSPLALRAHGSLAPLGISAPLGTASVDPGATFAALRWLFLLGLVTAGVAACGRRRQTVLTGLAATAAIVMLLGAAFAGGAPHMVLGFHDMTGPLRPWKSPLITPLHSAGMGYPDIVRVGGIDYLADAWVVGNVFGPYVNSNHFAGCVELTAPVLIGLLLVRWRQAQRRRAWLFVAAVVAVAALAVVALGARSRAGVLSLCAAAVFAAITAWPTWRLRPGARLLAVVLVAAAAVGGLWLTRHALVAAVSSSTAGLSTLGSSAAHRLTAWRAATEMLAAVPVTGVGLGAFGACYTAFAPAPPVMAFAHNDYVQFLAEAGVIGLAAGVVMLVLIIRRLVRARRGLTDPGARALNTAVLASLVAIAVHSFFDYNLHVPANAFILAVLLGLALGSPAADAAVADAPIPSRWPRRLASFIVVSLVAVFTLSVICDSSTERTSAALRRQLVGWRLTGRSGTAVAATDTGRLNDAIAKAGLGWTTRATAAQLRGLAFLHLSDGMDPSSLAKAALWLRRSLRLRPLDGFTRLTLYEIVDELAPGSLTPAAADSVRAFAPRLPGFGTLLQRLFPTVTNQTLNPDPKAIETAPRIEAGWQAGAPWQDVLPAYMGDSLELAVIPTPKQVVYSGRLLALDRPTIVTPAGYVHESTMAQLRELLPGAAVVEATSWLDEPGGCLITLGDGAANPVTAKIVEALGAKDTADGARARGEEGYFLCVTRTPQGRVVALLAGNSPAGDFWAVQTLRQLLVRKDENTFVVGAWMIDWPTFRLRGSKELRNYMPEYKDNFTWGGNLNSPAVRSLIANFGHFIPYYAPGGTLDCSDRALDEFARQFAASYRVGARAFAIKFDDVGANMTAETKQRFGAYAPALCYLMRELDRRAKAIDAANRLYYLPQCYHSHADYRPFAAALRAAGGLPSDAGLCWTGPEIFSRELPPQEITEYMEAFGLTQTKGLIYDNYGRQSDYFPTPREGREPALSHSLDGIFSENSTRLNRITRCDYNWNPEAYDPERALKLACRELSGRVPERYAAMYVFVKSFEAKRTIPRQLPRQERLQQLQQTDAELSRRLADLKRVLPSGDAMLADVTRAVDTRLRKEPKMLTAGFRETHAVRAAVAPVIDGRLDDACWQEGEPATDFVNWDQPKWQDLRPEMGAPVPAAQQSVVRFAYDDRYLYFAGVLTCTARPPAPAVTSESRERANGQSAPVDTLGIWHTPSIEIFLAPGDSLDDYCHLVCNAAGQTFDERNGQPAATWDSNWRVRTSVAPDGWTVEGAIPLRSLTAKPVTAETRWGLNICRTWPGYQMWTFVWGPRGFHTPEDFGVLVFD